MAKIRVSFKPLRKSEGDWVIVAEYPGSEPREITGFASKAEIDDWRNGERRISWLRSQGYAFSRPLPAAELEAWIQGWPTVSQALWRQGAGLSAAS